MGNTKSRSRGLFLALISVMPFQFACTSQNSGFATNVMGQCASGSSNCSPVLVNNNPNIFISSQGVNIPKLTSFINALPEIPTQPVSPPSWMPGAPTFFNQRAEINGTCNTGGAAAHLITYSIRNVNNTTIGSDIYGATYPTMPTTSVAAKYASPTYCDNGRFSFIITPPSDVVCAANTYCAVKPTYYINVQLWTGASMSALSIATSFETSFSAQF